MREGTLVAVAQQESMKEKIEPEGDAKMRDASEITQRVVREAIQESRDDKRKQAQAMQSLEQRVVGAAAGPTAAPAPKTQRARRSPTNSPSSKSSRSSRTSSSSRSSSSSPARTHGRSRRARARRPSPRPRSPPPRPSSARPATKRIAAPARRHQRSGPKQENEVEMCRIKFVQVADDYKFDVSRIEMAFPGARIVIAPAQIQIFTRLMRHQVIQRVDQNIHPKFRLFFEDKKIVFQVRPRRTKIQGPQSPNQPPPQELSTRPRAVLKPRPKSFWSGAAASRSARPPPFTVWPDSPEPALAPPVKRASGREEGTAHRRPSFESVAMTAHGGSASSAGGAERARLPDRGAGERSAEAARRPLQIFCGPFGCPADQSAKAGPYRPIGLEAPAAPTPWSRQRPRIRTDSSWRIR